MRSLPLAAAALLVYGACRHPAPPTAHPASGPAAANTGDLPVASDTAAESLLVDVRALDPRILVYMRYATADNFTGTPLPGYEANRALLRPEAARALARAEARAAAEGLTLLVYDAYRPVRATDAMVAWTRRTGREDLLRDGYIASRSRHNLGGALDVTLADAATGAPLPMGTPHDDFTPAAHAANATGQALANRQRLARILSAEGFEPYSEEWWHFSYPIASPVRFDLPIR